MTSKVIRPIETHRTTNRNNTRASRPRNDIETGTGAGIGAGPYTRNVVAAAKTNPLPAPDPDLGGPPRPRGLRVLSAGAPAGIAGR